MCLLVPQGLNFLDALHKVWTERKFNLEGFDPECIKWLLLLLQQVDVTGDRPAFHLRRFLLGKTVVVKKYRHDITKHVNIHYMWRALGMVSWDGFMRVGVSFVP